VIKQVEVNIDTSVIGCFVIEQVEVNTDTIVMGSFMIKQVEVNTDIIVLILWSLVLPSQSLNQ
jgi:metal-sulfur cluster biosynthetic enzyme